MKVGSSFFTFLQNLYLIFYVCILQYSPVVKWGNIFAPPQEGVLSPYKKFCVIKELLRYDTTDTTYSL